MVSIRQNAYPNVLPDFRNLGVIARVLVAVNAAALVGAIYAAPSLRGALDRFIEAAAFVEPLLFIEIVVFFVLSRWLASLAYSAACLAVMALAALVAGGYHLALVGVIEGPVPLWRVVVLAAALAAALLGYFRLLVMAFSPALAEARLQALQSRIRPHFLFNS